MQSADLPPRAPSDAPRRAECTVFCMARRQDVAGRPYGAPGPIVPDRYPDLLTSENHFNLAFLVML